jgi:hypothetical protein
MNTVQRALFLIVYPFALAKVVCGVAIDRLTGGRVAEGARRP